MKTLIIAAHGSRKDESNAEVAALAGRLAEKAGTTFHTVCHAFLQFARPSLEDKIDALIQQGSREIVVFPFFIGSGSHILVDIPNVIEQARQKHPGVGFSITRHLGKIEAIEDLILDEVKRK